MSSQMLANNADSPLSDLLEKLFNSFPIILFCLSIDNTSNTSLNNQP